MYGSWVHQTAHKGSDIDACELGNRYYQFENDFGYFLQKAGLKYPFEVWSNINLDTKEGSAGFLGNGYKIISPFPNVVEEADQTINALILSQDVIKGKIY